jgi:hypothetical protein
MSILDILFVATTDISTISIAIVIAMTPFLVSSLLSINLDIKDLELDPQDISEN